MKINYLREIVEFERWLEDHALPNTAQLLWHKLMSRCNKLMWPEWFALDNLRLMAIMQVSKNTLVKARDALIEAGRIEMRTGKKGSPNQYRLIPLCQHTEKTNFFAENKVKDVGQKLSYINKPKTNKKRDAVASLEKGTAKDLDEVKDLFNRICTSFPKLDKLSWMQKRAIKARMKEGRTVADFEKLFQAAEASEFLKGASASGWKATLDWLLRKTSMARVLAGSYAVLYSRQKEPRKNGFHNFEDRGTDYDALTIMNVKSWLETC